MSKKDEALKLALAFIEHTAKYLPHAYDTPGLAVHTAIREALAEQPAPVAEPHKQQEPVAWRYNGNLHEFDPSEWATGPVIPLYTSPQPSKPWVGLTDGQLNDLYATHHDKFGQPISAEHNGWGYERAIEANLREKNAS